jgi:hypothetical protein
MKIKYYKKTFSVQFGFFSAPVKELFDMLIGIGNMVFQTKN